MSSHSLSPIKEDPAVQTLIGTALDQSTVDEIFLYDVDGDILYANDSACRALGYTYMELTGMNIADIDPHLDRDRIRWSFDKYHQEGQQVTERVHRRKNGETFPVEISFNVTTVDGKDISCAIVRDITNRNKLLKETELLRFAVDSTTDAVYIFDIDGFIHYANHSAERELGYTAAELRKLRIPDIDPGISQSQELMELLRKRWDEAVSGNNLTFESTHRRKDGSTFPVELSHCIFTIGDEHMGISFVRNITERKEALRKTQELQFAIDNATDGVYLCSKDGKFYYVNHSASHMLGYERDQLASMTVFDVDPSVDRKQFEELWNSGRHQHIIFETTHRASDGREIPVEISTRISAFDGEEYSCSFVRDITERKQSMRTMEEFRFAIDNANDPVYLYDRAGDIIYANKIACKSLGYSYEELTGLKVWDIDPNVTASSWDEMYESVKAGHVKTIESTNRRKNGTTYPVEVTPTNVTLDDYEFGCSFNHDITFRKKTERHMLFIQTAINSAGDAVFFTNQAGDILYANQAACESLGYSREELLRLKVMDISPDVETMNDRMEYWREYAHGKRHTIESIHRRKDGTTFPIELQARVIEFEGELFSCAVARDVTERNRMEKALRESEERFRVIADTSPVALVISRLSDGRILYANRQVEALFDRQPEDIIGLTLPALFDSTETREELQNLLGADKQLRGHEIMLKKRDGSEVCLSLSARSISLQGELVICSALLDVTEAYELAQQLSYQASYDPLTGLVNRREFQSNLHRTILNARQKHTENALCFLDLDQFKVVNDSCGHIAGDELLRQLANLLRSNVRQQDVLARLGGDEFAILLENCNLHQAERVANAIRQAVQDFRFYWEDNTFNVGVSIGLVPLDWTSETTTDLLRRADTACYTAKDKGRNRIHIYHPDDEELVKRHGEMQWISRINDALRENRLQLWAQAVMPIQDTEEMGEHFELLVRLQDKNGNVISPDAFLPTAERYNIAPRIDRWVITTILNWYTRNPDRLESLAMCSINLSGQSLSDGDLLRYIIDYFESTDIDPGKFCFEVTETAAIANLTYATNFIKQLKQMGARFALDDFGSGLSSFAYLKNLPVDYLKIDGLFVQDVLVDPIDLAMVRSINEIGHVMGKKTIAEFVENQEILEVMRAEGIDYVQGYGIAKPAPMITGATIQQMYEQNSDKPQATSNK